MDWPSCFLERMLMSIMDEREDGTVSSESAASEIATAKPNDIDPEGILGMSTVEPVHPCLDFKEEGIVLGFRIRTMAANSLEERQVHLIGSDDGFHIESDKGTITLQGHTYYVNDAALPPLLGNRWSQAAIKEFLNDPVLRTDHLSNLKAVLRKYLDLPSDAQYGLIACWIVATYFAPIFQAFPFLHLLSRKETGKSKCLELIENIAFNASKLKEVSVAALGDSVDSQRKTILIDQAERLPAKLVGHLADSYKSRGAVREIVRQVEGKRVTQRFSLYGPKAFASMRDIDPDLADRCCRIQLDRATRPIPDFLGDEPQWAELRDACYRFLLLEWRKVQEQYRAIPPDGTRRGELWRPLQAVMEVLGVAQEEMFEVQSAFQEGTRKTKNRLSLKEEALFQVLFDEAEKRAEFEMTAEAVVEKMKLLLEEGEHPDVYWLGSRIRLLDLAEQKRKRTRMKHVHYLFRAERIFDLINRYEPHLEEEQGNGPQDFEKDKDLAVETENTTPVPPEELGYSSTYPHVEPVEPHRAA